MLFDEHRALGREHARLGEPRHKWSDPHLQAAYDQGYEEPEGQQAPGLPGLVQALRVMCPNCHYVFVTKQTQRTTCKSCGYLMPLGVP